MIIINHFNDLSTKELYEILRIRSEVFVLEQTCLYQDIDNKDLDAIHLFIKDDNQIVAYLRILKPGISYPNSTSLGRVLVKKEYRNLGLAKKITKAAINYVYQTLSDNKITISAQSYLISFYQSLGFNVIGDEYLEDDIPHIKMIHKKINQ